MLPSTVQFLILILNLKLFHCAIFKVFVLQSIHLGLTQNVDKQHKASQTFIDNITFVQIQILWPHFFYVSEHNKEMSVMTVTFFWYVCIPFISQLYV